VKKSEAKKIVKGAFYRERMSASSFHLQASFLLALNATFDSRFFII
jgi:hypothetical protein